MTTTLRAILLLAAGLVLASAASAHDYKVGSLEIGHPWARATPKGASVAGGYLSITNKGTEPDRLVGGSFAAAGKFEIHEMKMTNGVMRMRPIAGGVEIKPGQTVEFKSGGYHLMFPDLKSQLQKGQTVKGTLAFEKAGTVDVEFQVEGLGGPAPAASTMAPMGGGAAPMSAPMSAPMPMSH